MKNPEPVQTAQGFNAWRYQAAFLAGVRPLTLASNLLNRLDQLPLVRRPERLAALVLTSLAFWPPSLYESLRWRQAIRAQSVRAPVFILGHWRSGTTHLHYLLSQLATHGTQSMLAASFPTLHLSFGDWISKRFSLPGTRPMDALRWDLSCPQEEEIALSKLTRRAFFSELLTPQTLPENFAGSVLLDGLSDAQMQRWRRSYELLLNKISLGAGGRPLILKNPANTGRVLTLLEMYPDARFVFIHRHPEQVYGSMLRFYRSLFELLSLQDWDEALVRRCTLEGYKLLMKRYLRDRDQIPEGRLVELSYAELRADPAQSLSGIYRGLGLKGFRASRLDPYLATVQGYAPQTQELEQSEIDTLYQEWHFAYKAFGYRPGEPCAPARSACP